MLKEWQWKKQVGFATKINESSYPNTGSLEGIHGCEVLELCLGFFSQEPCTVTPVAQQHGRHTDNSILVLGLGFWLHKGRKLAQHECSLFSSSNWTHSVTIASLPNCTHSVPIASLSNCTHSMTIASLSNCTHSVTIASLSNCTHGVTNASLSNCTHSVTSCFSS